MADFSAALAALRGRDDQEETLGSALAKLVTATARVPASAQNNADLYSGYVKSMGREGYTQAISDKLASGAKFDDRAAAEAYIRDNPGLFPGIKPASQPVTGGQTRLSPLENALKFATAITAFRQLFPAYHPGNVGAPTLAREQFEETKRHNRMIEGLRAATESRAAAEASKPSKAELLAGMRQSVVDRVKNYMDPMNLKPTGKIAVDEEGNTYPEMIDMSKRPEEAARIVEQEILDSLGDLEGLTDQEIENLIDLAYKAAGVVRKKSLSPKQTWEDMVYDYMIENSGSYLPSSANEVKSRLPGLPSVKY